MNKCVLRTAACAAAVSILVGVPCMSEQRNGVPMNKVTVCCNVLGEQLSSVTQRWGPPHSTKVGEADVTRPAGWDLSWPTFEIRFQGGYDGLRAVSISGVTVEHDMELLKPEASTQEIEHFLKGIPEATTVTDTALAWKEIDRCYGLFENSDESISWVSLEVFVKSDGFSKAILTLRHDKERGIPWPTMGEYQLRDPQIFGIPTF